jgi:hypothetical protein
MSSQRRPNTIDEEARCETREDIERVLRFLDMKRESPWFDSEKLFNHPRCLIVPAKCEEGGLYNSPMVVRKSDQCEGFFHSVGMLIYLLQPFTCKTALDKTTDPNTSIPVLYKWIEEILLDEAQFDKYVLDTFFKQCGNSSIEILYPQKCGTDMVRLHIAPSTKFFQAYISYENRHATTKYNIYTKKDLAKALNEFLGFFDGECAPCINVRDICKFVKSRPLNQQGGFWDDDMRFFTWKGLCIFPNHNNNDDGSGSGPFVIDNLHGGRVHKFIRMRDLRDVLFKCLDNDDNDHRESAEENAAKRPRTTTTTTTTTTAAFPNTTTTNDYYHYYHY